MQVSEDGKRGKNLYLDRDAVLLLFKAAPPVDTPPFTTGCKRCGEKEKHVHWCPVERRNRGELGPNFEPIAALQFPPVDTGEDPKALVARVAAKHGFVHEDEARLDWLEKVSVGADVDIGAWGDKAWVMWGDRSNKIPHDAEFTHEGKTLREAIDNAREAK